MDLVMPYSGFLRRAVAYLLDMVPITLAVGAIFYLFFGFDETLHRYLGRQPGDLQARREFLEERRLIRNLSLAIYFLYAALLESSALQGTPGKWLLGIAVVDERGQRLNYARAWGRNSTKPLSFLLLGLGCLWVIWSHRRQAWHDLIAHTFVVKRMASARSDEEPDQALQRTGCQA
jgi:uncharacterized RDD family membrane protein YckC